MDLGDLVAAVRPYVDGAVIATDFDGTLAPLVPDPDQSRPVAGAIDALSALTRQGAHVAVITGRDAGTVVRLGGLQGVPGLVVEGLYGLERWHDGTLDSPETPPGVDQLRERLPELLADAGVDSAVWVEDKRLSLVVHARRAPDPDAQLRLVDQPLRELADELGFEVHPGALVLELRLPGYDKAGALGRLVERHDPRAVLFLGDDIGDLPAFAEIRQLREDGRIAYGVGVLASGAEHVAEAADVTVADPEEVRALLENLAGG